MSRGFSVLDAEAPAAGSARAERRVATVEDDRRSQVLDRLPKLFVGGVARVEPLGDLLEFESREVEVGNRAFGFVDAVGFVRIDAREADEEVWESVANGRDVVVRDRRVAGVGFCVPAQEDDATDAGRPVLRYHLVVFFGLQFRAELPGGVGHYLPAGLL